ncbi:MAG: hypothetical protein IT372_09685 [Polyangiaceae bacterium]|nr:hypothetical protein [Polyangiaceae bacterium]
MDTSKRSVRTFAFSSDKCDFVMRGETQHKPGEAAAERASFDLTLQRVHVGVSSDKCDWRVLGEAIVQKGQPARRSEIKVHKGSLQLEAAGPIAVVGAASDKCDWRLRLDEVSRPADAALAAARAPSLFRHELQQRVRSDKCDWRVVTGETNRKVEVSVDRAAISTRIDAARVGGLVESSKCEWSMKGTFKGMQLAPHVEARIASSKCDFSLQIQFGNVGGRAFRVQAVRAGSDKCDFRLKPVERSDDWSTWQVHAEPDKGS